MTQYDRKEEKLEGMLRAAGVTYFRAKELLTLGGSHYVRNSKAFGLNTYAPDSLLPSIVPAAVALDNARAELGAPVVVTNAYRNLAYNRAVGGAKGSFHTTFQAIDAAPRDRTLLKRLIAILRRQRAAGRWTGGLGVYSTFVHVDCGTARNRDW